MAKCKTCGGARTIPNPDIETMDDPVHIPCPDCPNPVDTSPPLPVDRKRDAEMDLFCVCATSLEEIADELKRITKLLAKRKK
jgi:hypothetical protein